MFSELAVFMYCDAIMLGKCVLTSETLSSFETVLENFMFC
jgi:hypothetical protein